MVSKRAARPEGLVQHHAARRGPGGAGPARRRDHGRPAACSRPAPTRSSSRAASPIASRTATSATSCASSSATSPSSASSPPRGSAFESEIWGDANVLMPALHRTGYYQTFVFRQKDPSRLCADQEGAGGRPAASGAGRSTSAISTPPRASCSRSLITRHRHVHHRHHGDRRGVRRREHHVRLDRLAHARDRHAARARLRPRLGHAVVRGRVDDHRGHRRRRRLRVRAAR